MPTLKCPISGAEVEVSTVEPGASGWTPNHRHDLVLVVDGAPVAVRERDVARDAIKHGRAWEFSTVEDHPKSHAKKEVAEVAEVVAEVKKALAEEPPLEIATPVDLGSNTHEAVDDVFGEPAVVAVLAEDPEPPPPPPPPPREPTPHAVHPHGRKRKS